MAEVKRYGNRRIDKMLKGWNALRQAVNKEGSQLILAAFEVCEEWIDHPYGVSSDSKKD